MTGDIAVTSRMSKDVHDELVEFRERFDIDSEAEAVRVSIRLANRTPELVFLIMKSFVRDFDEVADEYPGAVRDFSEVFAELVNLESGEGPDYVELADALGVELNPDTLRAFYRIESGKAGAEDMGHFFMVLPRINARLREEIGEPEDFKEFKEQLEAIAQ